MLRAALLVFTNEFRLLARDRAGIFMLVLAPVVIIAVAGFSLGNIYGASPSRRNAYIVPVVDLDRGDVAQGVIDGLRRDGSIDVLPVARLTDALHIIRTDNRSPVAIVIPARTTEALEGGHATRLRLYVDPVKRLEVNVLELRLNELCRKITARAQARARRKVAERYAQVRTQLKHLVAQVKRVQAAVDRYRKEFIRSRASATLELQAQVHHTIESLERQMRLQIDQFRAQRRAALDDMASRREALLGVKRYIDALKVSQREFYRWFATLKAAARSHSVRIPAPPAIPLPPADEQLLRLLKPPDLPRLQVNFPIMPRVAVKLPNLPPMPSFDLPRDLSGSISHPAPVLPGYLAWGEQSLGDERAQTNAFDQYVPGFGITFLFIAMLMAIGLGLIDERDWGTLQRLQVSGAPVMSVITGKLLARWLVGFCQMILLFGIGWWIFGISLGSYPLMLLAPTAAISFAAASISLLIACVARTHDSVMPVGATIAMAISAIGGCWWPLDFEPQWMRAFAQWLPTTWAMHAYNDLMIRHLEPGSALWPTLVTVSLALFYLAIGIFAASKTYE